jgi:hypothetical protein
MNGLWFQLHASSLSDTASQYLSCFGSTQNSGLLPQLLRWNAGVEQKERFLMWYDEKKIALPHRKEPQMRLQVSLTLQMDASATLATMEEQIQAAGHRWMGEALKQAVRTFEKEHHVCPHCGSSHVRLEGTVSRTVLTQFGKVCLARQRMRCQDCFQRFQPSAPLWHELHLGRVTPGLAEAAVLAGVSWPYRQAAQTLTRLSGASISAEEIRLLTNRYGSQQAKREEQASQKQQEQAKPEDQASRKQDLSADEVPAEPSSSSSADRTIIGMDGGWIPCRSQRGGMEGKVAVIASQKQLVRAPVLPEKDATWYELQKYMQRHRHRSVARYRFAKRRYVATFAPAASLGRLAARAVNTLELPPQEQVVVADGADWIKKQAQRHFPKATCILDWPHLWRTMIKAVRAVCTSQQHSEKWLTKHLALLRQWLWHGEVEPANALLLQWQAEPGGKSIKLLQKAITYLRTQQEWMGSYEQWKQQGYPIGSGIIERAVAVVINRRMKKQGMSWLRPNATAVVTLRAAFLNEEWKLPTAA